MASKIMAEAVQEQRRAGRRCGLTRFLTSQSNSDAREILALIQTSDVAVPAILRVLARRGYDGGLTTIGSHRDRQCRSCADLKAQLVKKGKP